MIATDNSERRVYLINHETKTTRAEEPPLVSTHTNGFNGLVDNKLIGFMRIDGSLHDTPRGLGSVHLARLLLVD
jgi:hypothetical protein